MKTVSILTALLVSSSLSGRAQGGERYVSPSYDDYYEWFHHQSQVNELYANRSTLYIFCNNAPVHAAPRVASAVVTRLALGQEVQNIAYREDNLPEGNINGYGDIWYHVEGTDPLGNPFSGYVWGTNIARGWRRSDITGDGYPEFVMLGIASRERKEPSDINAELRVLQNGRLIEQRLVPGLCIFEECDASPLLRIITDPANPGLTILEASAMTIGCNIGIDRAFFFWNGRQLDRVFHAEFTTDTEFFRSDFSFPVREKADAAPTALKVCHYRNEDDNHNPVWECQVVPLPQETAPAAEPPADAPKARAR